MEQEILDILDQLSRIADSLEKIAKSTEEAKKPLKPRKMGKAPAEHHQNLGNILLELLKRYQKETPADQGRLIGMGAWQLKVGLLTSMAEEQMGLAEGSINAEKVGHVLRHVLKLRMSERTRAGYFVCWDAGDLEKAGGDGEKN